MNEFNMIMLSGSRGARTNHQKSQAIFRGKNMQNYLIFLHVTHPSVPHNAGGVQRLRATINEYLNPYQVSTKPQ
jgi:hypothetical protein